MIKDEPFNIVDGGIQTELVQVETTARWKDDELVQVIKLAVFDLFGKARIILKAKNQVIEDCFWVDWGVEDRGYLIMIKVKVNN